MALRATISIELLQASVSSARTTTSVTYELSQATGIWTDPDSNNRMVKDELPLSDVRFNLVEKGLESSVSIAEQASIEAQVKKLETMLLVETFSKAVQFNRSVTDIFTLDDIAQIDKDFYGNKGNVTFVSDVIGLSPEKVIEGSFTFGDVATVAMDWLKNFSHSVSFSDSVTGSVSKIVNNAISFIESTDLDYSKGLSDSSTLDDQETISLIKNLTDSFSLDDFAKINKDFDGYKTNVFGFNEIVSSGISKEIINSIALVEAVGLVMSLGESDSLTVDDSNSVDFSKSSTDNFSFSDVSVSAFAKTLSDTISLDDFAQIDKNFEGNKGNVFGLSDVQSLHSEKGFANSFTMADSLGNSLDKPKSDSLSFSDTTVASFLSSHSEILNTSDVNYMDIVKGLADTIALDDTTQVNKDVDSTKGNVLGFSDTQAFGTSKPVTDTLAFLDELLSQVTKAEADSISFGDSSSNSTDKVNTDSVTASDNSYFSITKRLEDGFTLDDDFQSDENVYRNKANVFSFSDVYSFTQGKVEYDNISFSEAIDILLTAITYEFDSFSFADSTHSDLGKGVADSVSIDDTIDSALDKQVADSFTLDDTTKVDKDVEAVKGNVFGLSEVYEFGTTKPLADSMSFTDLTSTDVDRQSTDSMSFSESYAQLFGKSESSSFVFTDDNSQVFGKFVSDSFALDDIAQIDKDIEATKGNSLSFSESIIQSMAYKQAITESYTLADEYGVQLYKNLTTDFGITDQITVVHTLGSKALGLTALNTNTFN